MYIIWLFNIFPSMSSHNVNQIFLFITPSTGSTWGSVEGQVSRSVQTTLVRLDVRSSATFSCKAFRCSNYFQVSNLTTC